MSLYQQLFVAPLFFSFLSACICAWFSFRPSKKKYTQAVSTFFLFASLLATIGSLIHLSPEPLVYEYGGWPSPWGIVFFGDVFSLSFIFLLSVLAIISWVFAFVHVSLLKQSMFFFLLFALYGMILTQDLFNFYVFLEICSIAIYGLLFDRKHPASAWFTFRYLSINTVAASFYLMGLAFVYSSCGSLNMADLSTLIDTHNLTDKIGIFLISLGFCIKIALWPLHDWLTGAYGSSESHTTAFIAGIVTKVFCIFLIRFFFSVLGGAEYASSTANLILIFSCLSVIIAPYLASKQSDARVLLAYSSISQIAYIGIAVGEGSMLAFHAACFQIFHHAIGKTALFFLASVIHKKTGTYEISNWRYWPSTSKWMTGVIVLCLLSFLGIPPLPGFFVKYWLFQSALQSSHFFVIVSITLGSISTLLYVFFIIEQFFEKQDLNDFASTSETKFRISQKICIASLSILMLFLIGAYPYFESWMKIEGFRP
ncbi:MAG: hypothetical protein KDD52_01360 [Bdellovibrionales bacterium]|nr:hypothetical protein [Bdellovibrionales bacterium]